MKNRLLIAKKIAQMGVPEIKVTGIENVFKPEEIPALEPTPLGRHRLVQALRMKYGETFRNKPGVSRLIKDFDEQTDLVKKTLEFGIK